MDIERGIFYTLGYNDSSQIVSLIGFDKEGKLTCNWPLPFVTSAFVGVGEAVDVDSTNGEVFCMGLKVRCWRAQSRRCACLRALMAPRRAPPRLTPACFFFFFFSFLSLWQADGKHHLYRVNPRTGALRYAPGPRLVRGRAALLLTTCPGLYFLPAAVTSPSAAMSTSSAAPTPLTLPTTRFVLGRAREKKGGRRDKEQGHGAHTSQVQGPPCRIATYTPGLAAVRPEQVGRHFDRLFRL